MSITIPNPFNPGHITTVTVHFEPWNAHVWAAQHDRRPRPRRAGVFLAGDVETG